MLKILRVFLFANSDQPILTKWDNVKGFRIRMRQKLIGCINAINDRCQQPLKTNKIFVDHLHNCSMHILHPRFGRKYSIRGPIRNDTNSHCSHFPHHHHHHHHISMILIIILHIHMRSSHKTAPYNTNLTNIAKTQLRSHNKNYYAEEIN